MSHGGKVQFIDSHAHLDFADFEKDRESVLQEIFNAGCTAIVNPGTDLASSKAALQLAKTHPKIFAAVGIHPHEALRYVRSGDDIFDFLRRDIETLKRYTHEQKIVAIGECGLDYYRLRVDDPKRSTIINIQKELFKMQLELCTELKLPVIVHSRDSHEDVLELLDIVDITRGVAHCYEGSWPVTEAYLAKGFYISFTGNITYPKKEELHEVIKKIPLDRILLETDSPFLSPQARRGERNDSRSVLDVGETIARIKGIDAQEVFRQTTVNTVSLFSLPVL
jgi:TatD DNase family protein